VIDPATGECTEVELFVAVHGASNFTYAEVTAMQQIRDWVGSHVRAFEYCGGVSEPVNEFETLRSPV
jgi:transposase